MSANLVQALRTVADRLAAGAPFQWGHMGHCNCGHLAQVVTRRSAAEIHQSAILRRTGEWSEYANDYCPSGALIDDIFEDLLALGMTRQDIAHLEDLSDPSVLAAVGRGHLRRNDRDDAIAYFRAFADLLERRLPVPVVVTVSAVVATAVPSSDPAVRTLAMRTAGSAAATRAVATTRDAA
jgi:hypothetical protein